MNFGKILSEKEVLNVSGLTLAYIGDAVQSLYVRHQLATLGSFKAGDLHKMASSRVNAHEQANLAENLFDSLTADEQAVYLRGRNSKSHHKAKNQSGADYRKATGFEAVLGYLYLTGKTERICQLLGEIYEN